MDKFLKFWGTRGSCPVSGPQYARYGGNTCCLEVCYEDVHLVIDAGTGIRPLGETLPKQPVNLFFGHMHWDHIVGLPFFKPLYRKGQEITFWFSGKNLEDALRSVFASELFPVHFDDLTAQIHFRINTPTSFGKLSIDFHEARHPGGACCFKIQTPHQTIGYATDNELFSGHSNPSEKIPSKILEKERSLIAFFSDCDLLIHEAQYFSEEYQKKVGWGHSSIENVAAFVERAKIPQWLVTHHDPKHTDRDLERLEEEAQKLLLLRGLDCKTRWLADGEQVPLR